MSGVGTSSILESLKKEGYNVVDTDYGYTKYDDEIKEVIWDESKITQLIETYKDSDLFISGCYSNQGKFYQYFDYIVLITARLDVMLERVAKRVSNPYGKSPKEITEIIDNYYHVLPLLRKRADLLIDTTDKKNTAVCDILKNLL